MVAMTKLSLAVNRGALPRPDLAELVFTGGLDQITPPFKARPGTCRLAQNFEIGINGKYERILGYERFDGQARPSDAAYSILNCDFSGSIEAGDTITGATSAATAVVIAVTSTYVVITKISGTFQSGEDLEVSASVEATTTSAVMPDGAANSLLHAQYTNLAADEYRDDIEAVPGSGSILGVWMLNDVKYAFRNNAGGTAAALYKSSASGWTAVALGRELSFTSGGTTEILEGDTIEGATSGATAVVTRVVLESGTWAAGTAAGRFIFASQTGTFQSENIDVGANTNIATIAGDSSAITLNPDGRYVFINHNFGGQAGTLRMYGADGQNRGFEFDGTVFVPIDTGMDTDTPSHVWAHKNHLFFAFGSSAQHSGIGDPYQFTIITGAGEIAVGDTITAFSSETGSEAGGAMGIFSQNSTHILYGSDSSDWQLVKYRDEIGARAYTVRQVGRTKMLDDQGIMDFRTSQDYGNFAHSALSNLVKDWITARKGIATDACIVRDKNQYRIFFSDNTAAFLTFDGNKLTGIMTILLDHRVTCMFSLENSDGEEEIMFGSTDGMVYQMEKGTSFDGGDIDAYLFLNWFHAGNPRLLKKWMDCALEIEGEGYALINFSADLGYKSPLVPQPGGESKTTDFSVVRWDTLGVTWDSAVSWDGQALSPSYFKLDGSAENIALVIRMSSDYMRPVQISGAILQFTRRRIKR